MTKAAFENAITIVIALGGSTNAVLHILAMANAGNVDITLDDFTRIGKRVPLLADLKPSGRYLMTELIEIGGIQPLMKILLDKGLLHGDCLTVTGKTLAENLADVKPYPEDQDVIHSLDNPIKKTVIWSFYMAIWHRVVQLQKLPVKKVCALSVPPKYLMPKNRRCTAY